MGNEQKLLKLAAGHPHKHFATRPYFTRRSFFQAAAAGLTGAVFADRPLYGQDIRRGGATPINKAKNVLFILLTGAPSHTDTFDFKQSVDSPASLLKPETVKGIVWPTGLMPKLGEGLGDLCIVRSVRSWALQHNLAQSWAQIGRSPAAALGDIAPNIGTVIAAEKEGERNSGQVFPTFLALNSGAAVGSGYMPTTYSPLKITPATAGLPDTNNPDGQARFESKYELMSRLDGGLRTANPYSLEMQNYDGFYKAGKNMMFNPTVDQAFRFTTQEATRYGSSGFGNACLVAGKVLAARGGTRYIQISLGSWDHHNDIYGPNALPNLTRQLDNGLSTLISDMKSSGTFNETLIVMMGEFGRTVGPLTNSDGRDHHLQQFAVFAGAGVRGGRTIGETDATGNITRVTGWSRDRDLRAEDFEATIYSAMGIDWTSVRYDDPFGRGFYYVPESDKDVYAPLHELWS